MLSPPGELVADAALIEQSWRDPERFAGLYDRHAGPLLRYVSRRLGEAAADDIVADTFLIAFRKRQRYDLGRPDARPWLYGIAANLIHKQRRSEVRMLRALARTGVDPVTEGHADHTEQADARVVAQALRRDLAAALAGLSAGDRDVLLLIAWADFTYEETAQALGIPMGTVRSRLSRARRRTRAALGGHPPISSPEGLTHV